VIHLDFVTSDVDRGGKVAFASPSARLRVHDAAMCCGQCCPVVLLACRERRQLCYCYKIRTNHCQSCPATLVWRTCCGISGGSAAAVMLNRAGTEALAFPSLSYVVLLSQGPRIRLAPIANSFRFWNIVLFMLHCFWYFFPDTRWRLLVGMLHSRY
jgi:hypothetical protein